MGKTAAHGTLFNITFFKNDGVIPFYYEVKEMKMWVVDFCKDFFLTFIYQYIAFKSRKPGYLNPGKQERFWESSWSVRDGACECANVQCGLEKMRLVGGTLECGEK